VSRTRLALLCAVVVTLDQTIGATLRPVPHPPAWLQTAYLAIALVGLVVLGATRVYRAWALVIAMPAVLLLLAQAATGSVSLEGLSGAGILIAEVSAIYVPILLISAFVWAVFELGLIALDRFPRSGEGRGAPA
jgi:hypothetical protein